MTVNIAIPIYRVSCKVGIDKGRRWSVIEELLLWGLNGGSKTIGELATEANLPRQIVAATVIRLMRFRLIEVILEGSLPRFQASEYGRRALVSGEELPYFPKRHYRRISFVVCQVTGEMFPSRAVRVKPAGRIQEDRAAGREIRLLRVKEGAPALMTHDAIFARLSEFVAHGLDEELGDINDNTMSIRDDEFMLVQVTGKSIRGMPTSAGAALRKIALEAAAGPADVHEMEVEYQGERTLQEAEPAWRPFTFDRRDLVIGAEEQKTRLIELIGSAHQRIVIHSTFLRVEAFKALKPAFKSACGGRGVLVDVLWGAEKDERTLKKNSKAAQEIMALVRKDSDLNGRFRIHLRSTGSHSKLMVLDTLSGWVAAVSTCNWLYSDFDNVEFSMILRDPALVADVAVVLQHLAGQRRVASQIASDMALVARGLRLLPARGGRNRAALLLGGHHESTIRCASKDARDEFTIGTNRLGSTARPGAIMLAEVAASQNCRATVIYDRPSGPIQDHHTDLLIEEAARNGVRLAQVQGRPGLHGKFVAWDSDDLLVTSLNWGSAVGDGNFPYGEVGLHIKVAGIADLAVDRLREVLPSPFRI